MTRDDYMMARTWVIQNFGQTEWEQYREQLDSLIQADLHTYQDLVDDFLLWRTHTV